jgi:hypothetical protein
MRQTIAVVTTSRADYSHLYWPLKQLADHPDVDLKLIVLASHLSPEFGNTVSEIEKDGFPIAARLECLLSSDSDVGMAKSIGVAVLSLSDCLAAMRPDVLLLIADRYEMLAPAAVALALRIPIAHIEALGDAAVFAFYPNKQITTGEGGLVVTRDPHLAREIRAMRNHGRYESDEWHQHSILGYNYRLSEIDCALGCAQMRRISEILSLREQVARKYDALLRDVTALVLPPTDLPAVQLSWFVYVVRLADQFSLEQRDAIVRRTLALPFFSRLGGDDMERVSQALREAIEAVSLVRVVPLTLLPPPPVREARL